MKATTIGRQSSRVGLAFAALVSIAAIGAPAEAKDWNHRHHRHKHHHFSFRYVAPACYYTQHGYYYCSKPRHYPPPAYYLPPGYYAPAPSLQVIIPFGRRD
jgi:hypothetical protein